jgi:hypothetical protein
MDLKQAKRQHLFRFQPGRNTARCCVSVPKKKTDLCISEPCRRSNAPPCQGGGRESVCCPLTIAEVFHPLAHWSASFSSHSLVRPAAIFFLSSSGLRRESEIEASPVLRRCQSEVPEYDLTKQDCSPNANLFMSSSIKKNHKCILLLAPQGMCLCLGIWIGDRVILPVTVKKLHFSHM